MSLFPNTENCKIIYNTSHLKAKSNDEGELIVEFNAAKTKFFVVRSMEERSRIDLIIQVAEQLKDSDFEIFIVGQGPLSNFYSNQIETLNLKNIKLLGYVSHANFIAYYSACDIVLMFAEYGVEGFIYWHYWFGNGKRLLERPFNEVLASGEPDFPFCLAWANETWKGFAHGMTNRNILIEQLYPGIEDYTMHFYEVLPALKDERYIKIDGNPLFMIYKPLEEPEVKVFMDTWRRLAKENGLKGIYFVGHCIDSKFKVKDVLANGFEAANCTRLFNYTSNHRTFGQKVYNQLNRIFRNVPLAYPYKTVSKYFINPEEDKIENVFPSIIPGWDHTTRSGREGLVLTNSTPEYFGKHVEDVVDLVQNKEPEHKIIFLKSWNEWAEGNYMEPDLRWGKKYLEVLKKFIVK